MNSSTVPHQDVERLGVHGWTPTFTMPLPLRKRWGAEEVQQIEAALQQASLFYWGGPQTTLLVERFQEYSPLQYVMPCSSGTAAIHIAVTAAGIRPVQSAIRIQVNETMDERWAEEAAHAVGKLATYYVRRKEEG